MQDTYNLILAVLVFAIASCERSSNELSGYGKIRSPQGKWEIELLADEPGLKLVKREGSAAENGAPFYSPSDWSGGSTKDAFVFVDSNEVVWAFDGSSKTFIFESTSSHSNTVWSLATCPHPIPSEFLKRLPAAVARKVK
jgi:hypothetical protein